MSTVTTMAKFAEIEVCGKAFRLLKTHDSPIAEADTVHCIELGRAWDMESQTYTDNALSEANERFRQAEEALAARVQEAQTSKTELDSTTMPTQQNKEEILESQRARDEMMKPLLDKQYAENEQAPRDQQFWVVTIMRTSILVHSAHADSTSAENTARSLLNAPKSTVNDVEVLSGRSWFPLQDFTGTDLKITTFVNDDRLNSAMMNACLKQEMVNIVNKQAEAANDQDKPKLES